MPQDVMILPPKGAAEVMPVSAADAKAWELVRSVMEWLRANTGYNYREAFAELGVAHSSFYTAIKRPFVQNRLLERMRQQDVAEMELLDAGWLETIAFQMRLAAGKDGSTKEATAAARFIHERRKILEERLEATVGEEEGQSEAAIMLGRFKDRFGDGSSIKAVRTTVTEEVEVSS